MSLLGLNLHSDTEMCLPVSSAPRRLQRVHSGDESYWDTLAQIEVLYGEFPGWFCAEQPNSRNPH